MMKVILKNTWVKYGLTMESRCLIVEKSLTPEAKAGDEISTAQIMSLIDSGVIVTIKP